MKRSHRRQPRVLRVYANLCTGIPHVTNLLWELWRASADIKPRCLNISSQEIIQMQQYLHAGHKAGLSFVISPISFQYQHETCAAFSFMTLSAFLSRNNCPFPCPCQSLSITPSKVVRRISVVFYGCLWYRVLHIIHQWL